MPRVLVIEDSPTQACQLAFVLEDAEFGVAIAPDAEAGLRLLAQEGFDLVLSDLNLPGIGGFELCRRIKADPALRRVPVIVLTSEGDPVNVLRGLEAGADGFMTKDRDPAEVVGRVRRVLADRAAPPAPPAPAPVRVTFLGHEFALTGGRDQLLSVLLCAFEDMVQLNERFQRELAQRRKAEQALAAERNQLRTLLDNMPDPIYIKDAEGRYLVDNRAHRRFIGAARPEDVAGKTAFDLLPADVAGRRFAEDQAVIRSGQPVLNREERMADAAGQERWYATSKVPLRDARGQPLGLVSVSRDVTVSKQAAEELERARAAAEEANRLKSDFLANMSHEIRTPMGGILGMTDLALGTELTAEQRQYLDMVKSSAEALLTILNDILDFSKIEAGKLELEAIPFDLRDTLGDAMRSVAVRGHQKGLEVAYHVAPDVPQAFIGDPGRLRQVLLNLTGNAIKFTERGEVVVEVQRATTDHTDSTEEGSPGGPGRAGAVGASASSLSVSSVSSVVELHFTVRDTGIGIPPDRQRALFQPFVQADSSTTRKFGGTGLGLAISRKLVEAMNGRIWLESTVGVGTTFHFVVALAKCRDPAAVPPPRRPVELQGLPVLIVDDNATNRRILEEMVAGWRMQPKAVPDGRAALAELERRAAAGKPYPLVLLDGQMPEMDGFMLAERIRARRDWDATTLVMLSSSGQPGDGTRARKSGIAGLLLKPVKQSELLDGVLTALGRVSVDSAPAAPHPAGARRPPLRILLAEDNLVNQKLAVHLLTREGHAVSVAGTGKEALRLLEQGKFDLVLMDVQMPEMGGFEATGIIRERERATGGHIPIIALTAHAMKGDRERCLAAGMDGYVSKPIQAKELWHVIDSLHVAGAAAEPAAPPPPAAAPDGDVFDRAEALDRTGDDADLLRELADIFLAECPGYLDQVRTSLARGDAETLQRAAHTLKGALANLAAHAARDAAQRLESAARGGDLAACRDLAAAVEREVGRLKKALASLGVK